MEIIDLSGIIPDIYENGQFDTDRWKQALDAAFPGISQLCLSDLRECLDAGLSFEKDYLPVLNAVAGDPARVARLRETFHLAADPLEEQILSVFGRTPQAALVLYPGLCSGAGWAVSVGERPCVLLGIEKILELDWDDLHSMNGLILHELGHAYQDQFGILHRDFSSSRGRFLWQLFTEGIAMVFEQEVLHDSGFWHHPPQWSAWCGENLSVCAKAFSEQLDTMTFETQCFFGDWVRFLGQPDVGYYLGGRFVRDLLKSNRFDDLISWDLPQVETAFGRFLLRVS